MEDANNLGPEFLDKFFSAMDGSTITLEVQKGDHIVRRRFTAQDFASSAMLAPMMITLQLIEMGSEIPPKA